MDAKMGRRLATTVSALPLLATVACATPPMLVAELRAHCQLPGLCGSALACEAASILVRGRVDYDNVFDRSRFPNLPYEKFSLVGAERGQVIEIWVETADNASVFRTLLGPAARSAAAVSVRGVVKGFDMPMSNSCTRDVRVELRSAADLVIESK